MARKADVERLFGETRKAFGALDIWSTTQAFMNSSARTDHRRSFHKQFNLNVLGLIS